MKRASSFMELKAFKKGTNIKCLQCLRKNFETRPQRDLVDEQKGSKLDELGLEL